MVVNASSTLFYGVFVPTIELCMAASAWAALEPVFRAIDLVELRRKKGELHFKEEKIAVGKLPTELWEQIKHNLLDVILSNAVDTFVRAHHFKASEEEQSGGRQQVTSPQAFSLSHLCGCQECFDSFLSEWGVRGELDERRKDIDSLLNQFRLSLFSTDVLSGEVNSYRDLHVFSPISLPSATLTEERHGNLGGEIQTLAAGPSDICLSIDFYSGSYSSPGRFVSISPSMFALPADAPSRFRALFRLFPSLRHPYPTNKILPSPPSPLAGSAKNHEKKEEAKAEGEEDKEVFFEPTWHLWTGGWTDP